MYVRRPLASKGECQFVDSFDMESDESAGAQRRSNMHQSNDDCLDGVINPAWRVDTANSIKQAKKP